MSYIIKKISSIQKNWKQLAVFGAWIGTIAGSLILPLPDWGSGEEYISQTRFILFIATVVAGFILILTFKKRNKTLWIWFSSIIFILLILSFYLYNDKRNTFTLPYYNKTVLIGSDFRNNFERKRKSTGVELDDRELLKYVGGDASQIWTTESIKRNRNELIIYLTISYSLLAVFIVGFMNAIMLNTSKNGKT